MDLTTTAAAERLGVTTVRVRMMILARRLKARKFSGVWVIPEKSLKAEIIQNRKVGRPPKKNKGKRK